MAVSQEPLILLNGTFVSVPADKIPYLVDDKIPFLVRYRNKQVDVPRIWTKFPQLSIVFCTLHS